MATLHALTHPQSIGSVEHIPYFNQQRLNDVQARNHQPAGRWQYLLADTLAFHRSTQYAIRLPKPVASKLAEWMEKIITSGQCGLLFVEECKLDNVSLQRIKLLCDQYKVTLVNLKTRLNKCDNLIQGPW